jgi:FAD/FMN-containing dehydrogenase
VFDLRLAAQGTGHNAAPLGPLDDTILVKTERMRGIEIDAQSRVASIEAGVRSLELVEAAATHGLAPLTGSSPDVGVVGYTLGGGLSWFGRKHGLAASSVVAIELVTPDGRLVRADRDHEPELFWALRGGGGDFGIVTALELRLVPATDVYAGILWWPIEREREVLHAWAELTRNEPPDELTTVGRYLRLPPAPHVPEHLRGRSFVVVEVVHLGEPAQADELLAPLRALGPEMDTIRRIPTPALAHMHMDPEQRVPVAGDGLLLRSLPPEAIETLVSTSGAVSPSPLVSLELRHLGGELRRPRPENGALAAVDAEYVLFAVGIAPTPEAAVHVRAHLEVVVEALRPWAAERSYLNFTEARRDPQAFWTPDAHERLRRIKATVDPQHLIRSNHPVAAGSRPLGTEAAETTGSATSRKPRPPRGGQRRLDRPEPGRGDGLSAATGRSVNSRRATGTGLSRLSRILEVVALPVVNRSSRLLMYGRGLTAVLSGGCRPSNQERVMRLKLRLLVGLCALLGLAIVGSAAVAAPPAAYTCSGGSPGAPSMIPGGTYSSIVVTGVCTFAGDVKVNGDVTVADGATLNDHAGAPFTERINGNVTVGAGAILGLGSYATVPNNTKVNGNIVANGPKSLYLSGITVNGNVTSTGGGTGTAEFRNFPTKDNTINGNLTITGWQGGWLGVIRNSVNGNVTVSSNASIVVCTVDGPFGSCLQSQPGVDDDSNEVMTNWINGNLTCENNTPPAQVNPADGGQPNQVHGNKIGECASL